HADQRLRPVRQPAAVAIPLGGGDEHGGCAATGCPAPRFTPPRLKSASTGRALAWLSYPPPVGVEDQKDPDIASTHALRHGTPLDMMRSRRVGCGVRRIGSRCGVLGGGVPVPVGGWV
ncbi:MAG TPA: hypothetical protein VE197_16515, partial [Mycobacterium sp.]|nr:hypothetical protein [Mycobacterium sp.]